MNNTLKRWATESAGTFWLTFGGCGSAVLAAAYPGLGIGFIGAGGIERLTITNTGITATLPLAMGANKITGLAAGTVSAASTEAVNGSQLFGVASNTAAALGGGAAVNPTTGAWTAPS